jgi:hypothetical protein
MSVLTQTLSSNTAITFDLSSLATSTSFLSGRESTQIDNTSTNYVDAIVNVKGITSHASTAPTVGQYIGIWVWGADTSLATTGIDTLDGTDSAETLSHGAVLNSLRFAGAPTVTLATAALVYYNMPFSVASLFGGVMPKFWGLYVAHNHTGALGASNNSLFSFNGVTYTVT